MSANKILWKDKTARRRWIAAIVLSLLLLSLPWIVRLNGQPHADWQQFLGRFHPLAVHLPVTLILLVPLLELGGRRKPALREAAGFVLGLAFVGCIASVMLGYLLAFGSGAAGPGVTRHMWGGILLTVCTMLCLLTRPLWSASAADKVYPALLVSTLIVMMWAAHQGGSLTHGSNYLTVYAPRPIKTIVSLGSSKAKSDSFYVQHIDPIWDNKCLSCHGDGQVKGGLRMDTFEALMVGGKDGPVIVPNKPDDSLLLKRVTLPEGHKQFMPAEGKPPLSQEEIAWIRAWIQQGASPAATNLAGISIREQRDIPLEPVGDYSALQPEIDRMKIAPGAKLLTVSAKPSDGLILNTLDVAASFGDAQLTQFEKYAPYIVEVDLARTAVTDASFTTLAKFTHLRAIHLDNTNVTGSGLEELAALKHLSYLNLSGTKITSEGASRLKALPSLQHIYLFNTPAQPLTQAAEVRKTS
ncbi:c-type cytochrome domain-containing protein [Terriglobus roseus]|uniref:Uncharacterized membrane protein n=1 Tax=Terriglobus roseus TaxID=392734 RepID=A0A1G7HZF8_9BACT|nr:c-type cytochrome domain-containing protein [Terriglobus roseus]SDF05947.1 Uncharacterized membrane protein [Terriglobus roseus]